MMRYILFYGVFLFMSSCIRHWDNCEGEYAFRRTYHTSHPGGRVQLGETIELVVELPFKVHNYASCCDSMVDISRFNKVIMGFFIEESSKDSNTISGFSGRPTKDAFDFFSPNVKFDFTPPRIGNSFRVRYYLNKDVSKFIARIKLTPRRKGFFFIGLYDGVIEDAFCNAGVRCVWGNFSREEAVQTVERFLGSRIPDDRRESWLVQDNQGYYILVE